jgi:hypothetical protein
MMPPLLERRGKEVPSAGRLVEAATIIPWSAKPTKKAGSEPNLSDVRQTLAAVGLCVAAGAGNVGRRVDMALIWTRGM